MITDTTGANISYIAPYFQIMDTIRKSITFTNQQDNWIKLRVQSGDFTNDSEYIRDLVRKDQQENAKLLELKNAIDIGLQSGNSPLKVSDIIQQVDSGKL
ncbi:type II toxin-antitoxin system ParD family antitoxin [Allomuricauda sp. d1]|uniref:type II toxin-antitoxin system ParD family antitoxin n=1 Tax=Allomuricauda sp. d1 TaxID=3136725 RepID=UPI0031D52C0E